MQMRSQKGQVWRGPGGPDGGTELWMNGPLPTANRTLPTSLKPWNRRSRLSRVQIGRRVDAATRPLRVHIVRNPFMLRSNRLYRFDLGKNGDLLAMANLNYPPPPPHHNKNLPLT